MSKRIQVPDAERLAHLREELALREADVAEKREELSRARIARNEVLLDVMQLEGQMEREGLLP